MKLLIYSLIAFLALELAFCVACGNDVAKALAEDDEELPSFGTEVFPPAGMHIDLDTGRIIPANNLIIVDEGYLGGPRPCPNCDYYSDIGHPSPYDCIEYLRRQVEECK